MTHLSDRLFRLPGYPLADVPAMKRRLIGEGQDLIDLGVGDTDFRPPEVVVEGLQAAVTDPSMSKYGFQQGDPGLRQAIGRYMDRRFGVAVDNLTNVALLLGSKEGLGHLPLALVDPGDVVIIPEPGYQAYLGGTILAGGEPYPVALTAENQFLIPVDQLPEDVLRRARILYLNYPNNPTAAVAPWDYLERVIAACQQYDIVLAYDNAYCDITFDGYVAPSVLQIPGAWEVAIEFFSFSKTFAMTGWRLGWAVGHPELIGALTKVKTYLDTGPFLAVQRAAATALDRSEELTAPIIAELGARRDAGVGALRACGFEVTAPQAGMFLWVRLPDGISSAAFAREALLHEGVVVLPGGAFGRGGEGYMRLALVVDGPRLREAIERLGRVARKMTSTTTVAGA